MQTIIVVLFFDPQQWRELTLLQSLLATGLPLYEFPPFSLPAKYYPHGPRSSTKRPRAAVAAPERYVALLHHQSI